MTLLFVLLAIAALLYYVSTLPPLEQPNLDDEEFGGSDQIDPDATEVNLNG